MAAELILAPPAAGKTTTCIQRIQAYQRGRLLGRSLGCAWVLLPDRLQTADFRRRLAQAGGALGVFTGVFGDLYRGILEGSGSFVPVASTPLVHRLVQETVDAAVAEGALEHFTPLQAFPGFIQALRDAFAELKRALVYPAQLAEYARRGTPAQRDLAALYERYQQRLHEIGWADPEGVHWLAVEAFRKDARIAAGIDLLVVDGFDSFSGVQIEALRLLAGQVGELVVTFPGALRSDRPAHRRFTRHVERLVEALNPRITCLEDSPHLPPGLLHIEQGVFEAETITLPAPEPLLLEARSPAEEAREALRWIKRLAVREDVPLAECLLFTPNPEVYHPFLRAAAAEFGIPVYFTRLERLERSPAYAALLSLLSLPGQNFPTRLLFNLLRSPYFHFGLEAETVEQLERISRLAQIVEGREQWREAWSRLVQPMQRVGTALDDELMAPEIPRGEAAERLRAALEGFFERVTPPVGERPQAEWIAWVEDLLEEAQFYAQASHERDLAACDVFRQALRALVVSEAVAGERSGGYAAFLRDLRGTLEGAGVPEARLADTPVLLVGHTSEARGVRARAVAVLGLSEGVYPAVEHPDPFLDEELRRHFEIEPRLQREQAGLFYQAVTRSDQHLLLTRPYLSDDGERWEESPFWKAVKRLFGPEAARTVRAEEAQPLCEASSTQELLFWAARQHTELPGRYEFLSERWQALQHGSRVVRTRRARQARGPHEGSVEPVAEQLYERYSPERVWSASRLETYAACPHQFFIRYGLDLEAREEPQVGLNAAQLGSLLHRILELAYRHAADRTDVTQVQKALLAAAQQALEDAPTDFGFRPSPLWAFEQEQLLDKLLKTVEELGKDASWRPVMFEAAFGGAEALRIELEQETIRLHGVIDRVDRGPGGAIRVIDYKSGGSHLDGKDLTSGRRLQLPIYALAARDALDLGEPADGFYWNVLGAKAGGLRLEKYTADGTQGPGAAYTVLRQHLERILEGIRCAEFPPAPISGACPSYCPGAQWCWHYEAEWHG